MRRSGPASSRAPASSASTAARSQPVPSEPQESADGVRKRRSRAAIRRWNRTQRRTSLQRAVAEPGPEQERGLAEAAGPGAAAGDLERADPPCARRAGRVAIELHRRSPAGPAKGASLQPGQARQPVRPLPRLEPGQQRRQGLLPLAHRHQVEAGPEHLLRRGAGVGTAGQVERARPGPRPHRSQLGGRGRKAGGVERPGHHRRAPGRPRRLDGARQPRQAPRPEPPAARRWPGGPPPPPAAR